MYRPYGNWPEIVSVSPGTAGGGVIQKLAAESGYRVLATVGSRRKGQAQPVPVGVGAVDGAASAIADRGQSTAMAPRIAAAVRNRCFIPPGLLPRRRRFLLRADGLDDALGIHPHRDR